MAQITNTSDLRKYLCSAIAMVGNGQMDEAKARNVVKLAGQVHESLYSEAKIMQLQIQLGKDNAEFGKLKLHDE